MNKKQFICSVICVFIFVFLFDFLFHGYALKGLYNATLLLWRPINEHKMIYMFVSQLLFSFIFSFIYMSICRTQESKDSNFNGCWFSDLRN